MTARFDLHVHSARSYDGKGTAQELAAAAATAGLAGFAMTDHDAVWDAAELAAAGTAHNVLIIPGCEVSSLGGHILALGVTDPLPKGESVKLTAAEVAKQGGVCVASHPLRVLTGVGPDSLRRHKALFVAAEGRNGRERRMVQENTLALLDRLGLPATGGTDAHWIHDIGTAWTEFATAPTDVPLFLDAMRRGDFLPAGGSLARRKVLGHGAQVPWRRIRRRSR